MAQVGLVPTEEARGDSVAVEIDDSPYRAQRRSIEGAIYILTPKLVTGLTALQARSLAALLVVAAEQKERRR